MSQDNTSRLNYAHWVKALRNQRRGHLLTEKQAAEVCRRAGLMFHPAGPSHRYRWDEGYPPVAVPYLTYKQRRASKSALITAQDGWLMLHREGNTATVRCLTCGACYRRHWWDRKPCPSCEIARAVGHPITPTALSSTSAAG